MKRRALVKASSALAGYNGVLRELSSLIDSARRAAARSVNAVMTSTYFLVGRAIVEEEQRGAKRAAYGEELLERLGADLTERFGRGFSPVNLGTMRLFYLAYAAEISQTLSKKSRSKTSQTASEELSLVALAARFQLPWSHYALLVRRAPSDFARSFYETEALRGGWTVRQLQRQVDSQFYERTALSRNKVAMLEKGGQPKPEDAVTAEEEVKDPFVLEFLGLKDEYSESELEEALILRLEQFLLELGGDFTFVGRQRRLRVGNVWYAVDLLFFHRALRCLVIIDLKLTELTHADAGQMHLYVNYAREHWTRPDENPPVGLILCAQKDAAVAKYALEGLQNKVLAAEYRTALPKEKVFEKELSVSRRKLEERAQSRARRGAVDVHATSRNENALKTTCSSPRTRRR
jgi:predicted nuclease of restriction endonuclease-like (RecB) superfamily